VCELDGRIVASSDKDDDDKVVGERLRLIRRVKLPARWKALFASECAERAAAAYALAAAAAADDATAKAAANADAAAAAADDAADYAARAYPYAAALAAAAAANAATAADANANAERRWQTDRLLTHYGGLDPAHFAHQEKMT
jgi:hypothetical protein